MRRRHKLSSAPPELDGLFLVDPETHQEVFIKFEELHYMCCDMMDPRNADFAEDLGKIDWWKDPTYNMRRKK